MKKSLFVFLITSGMLPIGAIATLKYWSYANNQSILNANKEAIVAAICVGIICWLITYDNIYHPNPEESSRKSRFLHPKVPKALLHKEPCGIVFGMDKRTGKYVCQDIAKRGIAHELIIGGSGSGKSSCFIIPTLLCNQDQTVVAIDIKGELSAKSVKYAVAAADGRICILNPNDRTMYGFDLLHELNVIAEPTTQQIVSTWQQIAVCLITKAPDEKDPYWSDSARNLCMGLGIYYYKQGCTEFIDVVDRILGAPITEQVTEVLDNAKPTSPEYRYIVQFGDLTDDKGRVTLGTIFSNLANKLTLFVNDADLRYWLKTNPRRCSPYTVFREHKSMYIVLKEEKLDVYAGLLKLIIDQLLKEAERLPDISGGDGNNVLFVIDELPRILQASKLTSLLSGTKTLRSKGVILCMVTQSYSALQQAYSRQEVDDLINNCEFVVCLSAKDPSTAKMISAWCGKYLERSVSRQDGRSKSKSTSYTDKDILTEADLLKLQESGEAILISPYGWNRIKKTPYYKDRYFKQISDDIIESNKTYSQEVTT